MDGNACWQPQRCSHVSPQVHWDCGRQDPPETTLPAAVQQAWQVFARAYRNDVAGMRACLGKAMQHLQAGQEALTRAHNLDSPWEPWQVQRARHSSVFLDCSHTWVNTMLQTDQPILPTPTYPDQMLHQAGQSITIGGGFIPMLETAADNMATLTEKQKHGAASSAHEPLSPHSGVQMEAEHLPQDASWLLCKQQLTLDGMRNPTGAGTSSQLLMHDTDAVHVADLGLLQSGSGASKEPAPANTRPMGTIAASVHSAVPACSLDGSDTFMMCTPDYISSGPGSNNSSSIGVACSSNASNSTCMLGDEGATQVSGTIKASYGFQQEHKEVQASLMCTPASCWVDEQGHQAGVDKPGKRELQDFCDNRWEPKADVDCSAEALMATAGSMPHDRCCSAQLEAAACLVDKQCQVAAAGSHTSTPAVQATSYLASALHLAPSVVIYLQHQPQQVQLASPEAHVTLILSTSESTAQTPPEQLPGPNLAEASEYQELLKSEAKCSDEQEPMSSPTKQALAQGITGQAGHGTAADGKQHGCIDAARSQASTAELEHSAQVDLAPSSTVLQPPAASIGGMTAGLLDIIRHGDGHAQATLKGSGNTADFALQAPAQQQAIAPGQVLDGYSNVHASSMPVATTTTRVTGVDGFTLSPNPLYNQQLAGEGDLTGQQLQSTFATLHAMPVSPTRSRHVDLHSTPNPLFEPCVSDRWDGIQRCQAQSVSANDAPAAPVHAQAPQAHQIAAPAPLATRASAAGAAYVASLRRLAASRRAQQQAHFSRQQLLDCAGQQHQQPPSLLSPSTLRSSSVVGQAVQRQDPLSCARQPRIPSDTATAHQAGSVCSDQVEGNSLRSSWAEWAHASDWEVVMHSRKLTQHIMAEAALLSSPPAATRQSSASDGTRITACSKDVHRPQSNLTAAAVVPALHEHAMPGWQQTAAGSLTAGGKRNSAVAVVSVADQQCSKVPCASRLASPTHTVACQQNNGM